MNKKIIDFAYLTMCAENDYIYETGEAKALLDYITNLQQENKELKEKIKVLEWDINDKKGIENSYIDLWDKNRELHNKIDKAIEYLINPPEKIWEGHSIDEVVRILKGDVDD